MLKKDVQIGGTYAAKVSNKLTTVRVTGFRSSGAIEAVNTATGRSIRLRTAARLRGEVTPPVAREKRTTTAKASQPRGDMPKRTRKDLVQKVTTEAPIATGTVYDLDAAIDDAVDMLGEYREAVPPSQKRFLARLDRCIQVLTDHIAY